MLLMLFHAICAVPTASIRPPTPAKAGWTLVLSARRNLERQALTQLCVRVGGKFVWLSWFHAEKYPAPRPEVVTNDVCAGDLRLSEVNPVQHVRRTLEHAARLRHNFKGLR